MAAEREHPVMLFDGECNLCSGAVQFVVRRDSARQFRFASLQSAAGNRIAAQHGRDAGKLDTLLLLEDDVLYDRSTAAIRIARRLRFPWPAVAALWIVPRPLRDAMYCWVARNRYRWFGKRTECMIPTSDLAARFLTD